MQYAQSRFDRACRKYEEALSIWRYFEATDPKWQEQGIDDDKLVEEDFHGDTPDQKVQVNQMKISCYMNIATCNIKTKNFDIAAKACNEVLSLDGNNIQAFYRRAKSIALPINAGVPDLRLAVKDLDTVIRLSKKIKGLKYKYVEVEKERVQKLIDINYKRE